MIYQKIGEQKYPIEKFSTFPTQLGNTAVRISGDTPIANGFEIVDDEDNVIADCTAYTYLYREDDNCKEYTKVAEEQIPTESYASGDIPESAFDVLSKRISAVNNRVSQITPYEQSKVGYYGEIEKVFYGVPSGNVSVFFDNYNGEYEISRVEDRLTIKFPKLEAQTNISIMVQ